MLMTAPSHASPSTKAPALAPIVIESTSAKSAEEKIMALRLAKRLPDQEARNRLAIQRRNLVWEAKS